MEFIYDIEEYGLRIRRCLGDSERVEIPEEIEGRPVYALAPYAFSDLGGDVSAPNAVSGMKLKEICLPKSLRLIGGYAFYGCRNLEKMTLSHMIREISGGAFTGCYHLRELTVHMEESLGYCLKDMVSELRQEIRVTLLYEDGQQARLLFPEYYEEAVENTPARIVETHFHGSGYRYRQCFRDGQLNYQEYDGLFPEALAWECDDFCLELALLRLRNPYGLCGDAKGCYQSFLMENRMEAAFWCMEFEQNEALEYISGFVDWSAGELTELIAQANQKNRIEIQSFLLDYKHRNKKNAAVSFVW